MRKIFSVNIIIFFIILLTGCKGIPHGDSIEDCMETENCYYHDNNVKTEGSDLSIALIELLIDQSDDLIFFYSINPGGDSIGFEYYADRDVTYDNIIELIDAMAEVIDTVNGFYSIDDISTDIFLNENLEIHLYFDEAGEIDFLYSNLDYETSREDTEEDILLYLDSHIEELKELIDLELFDTISWYGTLVSNCVYIDFDNDSMKVLRFGNAHTDSIDDKISELLQDYNFTFFDPDY